MLKRLFLQLYRPLRQRQESLTPDRWLLLVLLPPAVAVFVALVVCLLGSGQAGQFAVGGAIAILLAGTVYALLAIQASFFGPTVHNADQALAALQNRQRALLAEVAALRSRSAARRPTRTTPTPPREALQAVDSSQGAPTGLRVVFEFGGYALWSSVCFSPDSTLLALKRYRNERPIEDGGWTEDHIVELWELDSGKCRTVLDVGNRLTRAGQLRFSPDGTVLAAARRDDTVQLFDVRSGRCMVTLRQQHTGEDHVPTAVAFSPDGTLLASAFDHSWFVGDDRHSYQNVDLWDTANRRCIASVRVTDVPDILHLWLAFDSSGKYLAVASTGWLQLYDVGTGRRGCAYRVDRGEWLHGIGLDESGRLTALASAMTEGDAGPGTWYLKFWDVSMSKKLVPAARHLLTVPVAASGVGLTSPDFKLMAISVVNGCSEVVHTVTGTSLLSVAGVPQAFSPSNRTLVTALDKTFFGRETWGYGLWRIPVQDGQGADRSTGRLGA